MMQHGLIIQTHQMVEGCWYQVQGYLPLLIWVVMLLKD
jgi:hypothetical protein